jgi:hypothetical protein
LEGRVLFEAAHEIHILDGLAGSALGQVVNRRHDDGPPGPVVDADPDIAVIRPLHGGYVREDPNGTNSDKSLVFVKRLIEFHDILLGDAFSQGSINGAENPSGNGE